MARNTHDPRQNDGRKASRTPMKTVDPAETELVRRAQQGDVQAQQVLWNRHKRWVAAIILAHRPREIDVEDLMQDVAVKFIDKLDSLRDPQAFRPWMRQIVINACRGAARSLKPTMSLVDREHDDRSGGNGLPDVSPPASDRPTSEQQVDRRDAAECVLQQVLTLPSEYREPLLLRCVRSLTYQQIGEILGLPVTTVETRLARARRMLREEVGDIAGPIQNEDL